MLKTETRHVFLLDVLRLICHGLTLGIFFGFLGSVMAVGDSLAIFRIEFTVLLAFFGLIAFLAGRSLIPAMASITVLVSVVSIAPFWGQSDPIEDRDLRLHQHNVLFGNRDLPILISKIRETDADVLTLQEISEKNFNRLRAGLEDLYPHYSVCLYTKGGVAVLAKDMGELLDFGCVSKSRLAWLRVDTPKGPVTVASVHQLWPWPEGQFWQKQFLTDDIVKLEQPIVMGGDFNNVPWSGTVRAAAQAADGKLARGMARSFIFNAPWPRFRIDHVIAPISSQIRAELSPSWGSDHFGVTADIKF